MNSPLWKDIGYLTLRLGFGAIIARYGWPKLIGGTELWETLGSNLAVFGITFLPVVWGGCAAVAEFFGGICVAVGIVFRPACALIVMTLFVAFYVAFLGGDFVDWASPAALGIGFLSMFLMGPGRFSLSVTLKK
jgi:putative oxidoreductase